MKRDLDLVRKLLVYFEDKAGPEPVKQPLIDGYSDQEIQYHLVLLFDAGFLRCEPTRSTTSDRVIMVLPFELTWAGQEFLAKIRDETVWNRTKTTAREKGIQMTIEAISAIATAYAKAQLGLV